MRRKVNNEHSMNFIVSTKWWNVLIKWVIIVIYLKYIYKIKIKEFNSRNYIFIIILITMHLYLCKYIFLMYIMSFNVSFFNNNIVLLFMIFMDINSNCMGLTSYFCILFWSWKKWVYYSVSLQSNHLIIIASQHKVVNCHVPGYLSNSRGCRRQNLIFPITIYHFELNLQDFQSILNNIDIYHSYT